METNRIRTLINKLSSRLGLKLFVLLTAVITLSIAPLAYTSLRAIKDYGEEVSSASEEQIRTQALSYLKKITQQRAHSYQALFDRLAVSAGLLGAHASAIYTKQHEFAQSPLFDYQYTINPENGFWSNRWEDPVVSIYWGDNELSIQTRRELDALTHMTPLFTRVLKENPEVLASHVITLSGIGQYYTENPKSRSMAHNLPPLSIIDLRDGAPVTIFTHSPPIQNETRWTEVYKDDASEGLALTASAPIIDEDGDFLGIAGIDVPLKTIIDEVISLGTLDTQDRILFAFLTDRSGRLIAFPEMFLELFGLAFDPTQFTDSSDSLTLRLGDSSLEPVKEFTEIITKGKETYSQIELANGTLLATTNRLPKLDWVFGLVVWEADMFALVEQGQARLDETIKLLEIDGALLTLFTVSTALAIVFLSVKYLVTPLRTLAAATKRVAEGDLSVRCPVSTRDEAGVLAESFNHMVERLNQMQEQQKQYADALEVEVAQRNIELVEKRNELEQTIEQLNKEVERRQIISEALRNSQQQYYDTLEANKAGIYIITDNRFSYVNNSLANLLGMTSQELIGRCPLDYISQEDKNLVASNMQRRLEGTDIPPYRVRCLRGDGTPFYGEVWAKITTWQNRTAMVGTITDVSHIMENEERIHEQDRQLRKSLEEKEILLKEIYHRTKNNMLVIISMLELQKQDIDDERVLSVFHDTENRIRAMALVHEKLYQSQDLTEIDLGSYLRDVVHSLVGTMVLAGKVKVDITVVSVPITIDYAIPLGLVINELVTNSLKHAFPTDRTGRIRLDLERDESGQIRLVIGDDGIGLPDDFDLERSTSFGMQLVNSLISLQLKGKIITQHGIGTSFEIVFDDPVTPARV